MDTLADGGEGGRGELLPMKGQFSFKPSSIPIHLSKYLSRGDSASNYSFKRPKLIFLYNHWSAFL